MFSRWFFTSMVILAVFAGGCETTKGLKKDLQNSWHNAQGVDAWMKENLW